jgi:transposase
MAQWLPHQVNIKTSVEYKRQGEKDEKERRVYSKDFKAEAAALAEKKEKPISRIALDLGINENMRRWMQQAREAAQGGLPAFFGQGRPQEEELTRLQKEVKVLREANEILKKRLNLSLSHVRAKRRPVMEYQFMQEHKNQQNMREMDISIRGVQQSLLPIGEAEQAGRRTIEPHTGYSDQPLLSVWEPSGAGSGAPGLGQTGQFIDAGKRLQGMFTLRKDDILKL